MIRRRTLPIIFLLLFVLIGVATIFGPSEQSLGDNVRLVYLHGAWVWTAMLAFLAAAIAGLIGLILRELKIHRWSSAIGQAGLLFWITYLPLSLWTMQANWNGLYLAEPRWRIGVHYAIIGLLLQAGLIFLRRPPVNSAANILFLAALLGSLSQAEQVMHPPSPIMTSESDTIRFFFFGLTALCLAAAGTLAAWLRSLSHSTHA